MIRSFANAETQAFCDHGVTPKVWESFSKVAARKIDALKAATRLDDLRSPPGNKLHALSGDRKGFYAIRINDQYRVCFRWESDGAYEVEILDYH